MGAAASAVVVGPEFGWCPPRSGPHVCPRAATWSGSSGRARPFPVLLREGRNEQHLKLGNHHFGWIGKAPRKKKTKKKELLRWIFYREIW